MVLSPEAVTSRELSHSAIRSLRQAIFEWHGTDRWTYGIDRGAFGTDPYASYEPNLPYLTVDDRVITWRNALYGLVEQAQVEGRKARILDIGMLSQYFSTPEDFAFLRAFWEREYGFKFNNRGIAFQGSDRRLKIPVHLAGVWTDGHGKSRSRYAFHQ